MNSIITYDDFKALQNCGGCSVELEIDHPTPELYLQYSKEDILHTQDERSRINCIANAKRALHRQIDFLAKAFGFDTFKNIARAKFPDKLDFCAKCLGLSPRLLRKINKKRNIIEHEYHIPSYLEAEEFIDIVELFLFATSKFTTNFPTDMECGSPEEEFHGMILNDGSIRMEEFSGKISIEIIKIKIDKQSIHEQANKLLKLWKSMRREVSNPLFGSLEFEAYRSIIGANCEIFRADYYAGKDDRYFYWTSYLANHYF